MRRLVFVCCAVFSLFILVAPGAGAVDIIEGQEPGGVVEGPDAGFQAGVCTEDPCTAETPERFFRQAGGHAPDAFVQIIVKHDPETQEPVGEAKTFLVDLPAGLSVDAQAVPQCELEVDDEGREVPNEANCPADTRVGTAETVVGGSFQFGDTAPVYNLRPREGEPARFGFAVFGVAPVILQGAVAWQSDYHEFFTIHIPRIEGLPLLSSRLSFDGTAGQEGDGGALVTNPSTCENPEVEPFRRGYSTILHADSIQEEAPEDEYDVLAPAFPPAAFLAGSQEVVSPLPRGARPEGCEKVPFEPTVRTEPGTTATDSAAPATVEVKVPFEPHAEIYQSTVKSAKLTLPEGMGLNPAAAPGLGTCTEAQFGEGTRRPLACPADSRLGSVSIETPVLPRGSLKGSIYLAAPEGDDPESGRLYRVFLEAGSAARGVSVRLSAGVSADRKTGRLTATVEGTPQLPFTSVAVKLDGRAQAPLTSPSTCGPAVTTHAFGAWSGSPDRGATEPGFTPSDSPAGGNCAKTGAERPFAPFFVSAPASNRAKSPTSYTLTVQRKDGEGELKGIDVTLPPGLTANLAGVAYCPEASIAAAASSTGRAQYGSPSCPESSFIGTVAIAAGPGGSPLRLPGNAYLAGPYKGAPLSLAIVTPVVAGPFDLGTVVVRAAVFVEPESGRIHVVSDPIPSVVGGAEVDLRSISLTLSRGYFVQNGTSCRPSSVTGTLSGGGSDPNAVSGFTSDAVGVGSWVEGCRALEFEPVLKLGLTGATKRASHPHLHAVLKARSLKDADIAALSVALPKALILDQANLGNVCTRPQFAADECPAGSVYGHATVTSPLLAAPLSGPVILRSSSNPLPDLVVHLEGQVDIDLVGRIDSYKGGIRTSFEDIPDLPVSELVLDLPGGRRGLLEASRNICAAPVEAHVLAEAHNSRRANLSRAVTAAGCR